ncbi:FAD-dependent oxidoreductase [Stenoxybacter acetivorans]|uniref:FAD-dependent oxidoreductase n=1 Tax=Stenoxybacter acetivorans TaxID=422441 RepID=UPI00055FC728|nr:FAD-dependent oxidoreductase [Stenoxybacter acetivorans]
MLNLSKIRNVTIVGGGTAGWCAAIMLRGILGKHVDVTVIESTEIGVIGVGEGGLPNLMDFLDHNNISLAEFIDSTQATFKWGFSYEGWRTGKEDDRYFHLFGHRDDRTVKSSHGMFPYLSELIAHGIPLEYAHLGVDAIYKNVDQVEAFQIYKQLSEQAQPINTSFHFDSYRIAKYFGKTARERGVKYHDTKITDVLFNEQGYVTQLVTESGVFDTDFVIDASGLARLVINRMQPEWETFSPYLLMNAAIPFNMPHPFPNPCLYSRGIAMDSGWMWQIPLIERVGAGYVFSSQHISPEKAHAEVERKLGYKVEINKLIQFDPGCHREVWKKNVMALGLSSGFVEPLEATSIGQMLDQLRLFASIFATTLGVIPQHVIDNFNIANHASWMEIRDFLRMHYDVPRQDTPFWQDVAKSPYPESYRELKEVWQLRTPRAIDLKSYAPYGRRLMFGTWSWTYVGAGVGSVSPQGAASELSLLKPEMRQELENFRMESLQKKAAFEKK